MTSRKTRGTKLRPSTSSARKADRGVDTAMAVERPAKRAIRKLWLEQAQYFDQHFPENDVPLYLTLSGAEARDIRLFAQNNLIQLTEVDGIATESQERVIAIEANKQAVLKLQRQMPGLKILEYNVKEIIHGDSLTRFPVGENEKFCCAKVVNLDIPASLHAVETQGAVDFPVLTWIRKISQLHATRKPGSEWCLCLTLNGTLSSKQRNGTIVWSHTVSDVMQKFLKENFQLSVEFSNSCLSLFGEKLYGRICGKDLLDLGALNQEEQQKLLMVFVPKKISQLVRDQNWRIKTTWNLRYGGRRGHAPMVTWVLSFIWDPRATSTPDAVYKDSLNGILASVGRIEDDGRIKATSLV